MESAGSTTEAEKAGGLGVQGPEVMAFAGGSERVLKSLGCLRLLWLTFAAGIAVRLPTVFHKKSRRATGAGRLKLLPGRLSG